LVAERFHRADENFLSADKKFREHNWDVDVDYATEINKQW
jgi:hypothetical protein